MPVQLIYRDHRMYFHQRLFGGAATPSVPVIFFGNFSLKPIFSCRHSDSTSDLLGATSSDRIFLIIDPHYSINFVCLPDL